MLRDDFDRRHDLVAPEDAVHPDASGVVTFVAGVALIGLALVIGAFVLSVYPR